MSDTNLEAVQHYHDMFKQIGRYGGMVGVNMVQPNYRPTLLTFFMLGLNISLVLSSLYTMIWYDSRTSWLSSNVLGITIQGLIKYYVLMKNHKGVYGKVQFLGRVYMSNTSSSSLNFYTLHKWSRMGAFFAKYGVLLSGSTCGMFVLWAIVATIWNGEPELILYFMLPGLDPKDLLGYSLLCVYHLISLALGVCGTCGADFMLVILVFHLCPLGDILDNMCNELNAVLLEESNRKTPELKTFFYNVVKTHREICEYLEDLSRIYYSMLFVECYTCAFTLCTLLYCMFTMDYYPLYMMCALIFLSLLIYCLLGTVAELAMDRVYASLSCSKWYLLPLAERRCMSMIFAKAQNPVILMAGAVPLNLDTFVQLMKTVYSVGMMLLKSTD